MFTHKNVLSILAGVAINLSLGQNGLFNKAKYGAESYTNATQQEETDIAKITNEIDNYVSNARDFLNDAELLATVTQTEFTEFEIPALSNYKYFLTYIYYPTGLKPIVGTAVYPKALLLNSSSTANHLQNFYQDGNGHYGIMYYNGGNKIKARIISCDKMLIFGIK